MSVDIEKLKAELYMMQMLTPDAEEAIDHLAASYILVPRESGTVWMDMESAPKEK